VSRIAVITANCGGFDPLLPPVAQEVPLGFKAVEHFVFDDRSFPRRQTMSPRLQARIPKMFAWEMLPDFEFYIWHDASYSMQHPQAAAWFVERCDRADACFFMHPHRRTVAAEADYIRERIARGDKYIASRYLNEDLDGQVDAIDTGFWAEDFLIASSAFAYYPTPAVQACLREWWLHTSRYHAVDQLALPYVLWKHRIEWNAIELNVYDFPYLLRTREGKRA
jgi:hypothetical protein